MLVPTFLLSPLFGIAADRIDTHRGLLATTGLQAFVSALAGALAFAGLLNEHSVLLLALLFGAITRRFVLLSFRVWWCEKRYQARSVTLR